jgi:hypothetical protein
MNKIKDVLFSSLGVFGIFLWYLIGFIVMFTPLIFLDFSFLGYWLIIIFLFIPFIGDITNFIIWICSFNAVISEPIDGWSVFYFVIFAFYCLTTVLPYAINIIVSLFANTSDN